MSCYWFSWVINIEIHCSVSLKFIMLGWNNSRSRSDFADTQVLLLLPKFYNVGFPVFTCTEFLDLHSYCHNCDGWASIEIYQHHVWNFMDHWGLREHAIYLVNKFVGYAPKVISCFSTPFDRLKFLFFPTIVGVIALSFLWGK